MLDLTTEFGARADRRLREEAIGWFVTVRPDGTPIPVPVWFVWDGESIVLYSQPRAGKLRNIAANPRVSLHLDTDVRGDDMIVVTGTASVDETAPPMHELPAYAEKYRGRVDASFSGKFAELAADYSVAVRIVADRISGF
ncbi:MAG: TIGR03667 family PPOX class F420-dependent oxidoreductase [Chloroflexi bacterium]|nr:TIGR03667 family PPOX class F420-dependent oxidoreductase [Chloroflexota bacterium]